ncbi:MAG: ABC transporter substrate-binding protein [Nitrospirota bacterium]
MRQWTLCAAIALGWWFATIPVAAAAPVTVRVAHFPNITHAQALIGRADGSFARALGPDAAISWKLFSAGPAAVQALFAGELDVAYLGTGPAIVGYVKSRGEALRIISGSADGGAALVVRDGAGINGPADFHGKRVATPQLGNTQDVALRGWLVEHGLDVMERGGDVRVIPMANAEQLTMFRRGELDAAWTAEPWVSRLVHEGGGRVLFDEREEWQRLTNGRFATTVLVAHPRFLAAHPELATRWVQAHVELTARIVAQPEDAKRLTNEALKQLVGKPLGATVLDEAWGRVAFTTDPIVPSLVHMARWAFDQGFLGRREPDLSRIVDGRWLADAIPVAATGSPP